MKEERKKYFFVCIFDISPCVFTQISSRRARWMQNLINFASNEYPHCILLTDPTTSKTRNTWKMLWWHHHHVFSGISCFWGSGVHQKYVVWVLVGCGIKFHIQRALFFGNWVKTHGDMSKIQTKKYFFLSSFKINKYYFIIFLRRPILDLKFPLIAS